MYPLLPWISLATVAISVPLWLHPRFDQGRIRATWAFLSLWLVAFVSAFLAHSVHQETKVFDEVGRAFVELAILNIGAILVFDYGLAKIRLPRLATEITLVAGFITIVFRLLTRLGSDITGLIATSAVATAVIGFALQDMLGNVVGGAVLELEGGIKPGEWIKSGEYYGCVGQVRLRHTEIVTADGDSVYIPNSVLTRTSVTKVKRLRRAFVPFLAPYSHSPQEVQKAIESALIDSSLFGVSNDPRPKCVVQEFTQSFVRYAAVVWLTEPGHETTVISGVLTRIYFALSRTGVPVSEIPQIIELHKPRKEDSYSQALTVLRNTPIFRLLKDSDLEKVAGRLKRLTYAPGEFIVRQGERGDSMFFITEGEVEIVLTSNANTAEQVATLSPGEFVGESCLLTGEPRNANVLARTAVCCYTLDKQGLQDVMERSPEIAEDMAVVVAHRSMELAVIRERLDNGAAKRWSAEEQVRLVTRIRRFFGIDTVPANQVN